MKRLADTLGLAAFGFYCLFGVLALFVLGTLIAKGTPDRTPAYILAAKEAAATADDTGTETAATEGADAVPAAHGEVQLASLDPAAGAKVFNKCKACHSADKDGGNKVGPALWGVLDRPAASADGFEYSDAMGAIAGEPWSAERLDQYLTKPKDMVPGTTMSFAGLKKAEDRQNLIAWLAGQSDSPVAADALPFAVAAATGATAAATAAEADAEPEAPEIAQIAHVNPPEPTAEEQAAIAERVAALTAEVEAGIDYERARFHPLHFPPAAQEASNAECLVCHQEIMTHEVRAESTAGVKADTALAWYQTLDTYFPKEGSGQSDFHWRHLQSPYAQSVMNMQCTFCHKANDPREETPDMVRGRAAYTAEASPEFTLRKMVNPSETCLRCHGQMPDPENIMGLGGSWPEVRADMEDQSDEDPTVANGCLSCHQELYRTNRHNVTYLKAANIEELAESGSDTCYGCHGGRAWYRISYPYPRTPWPDMDTEEVPEWAADRASASDPQYAMPATPAQQ